MKVIKMNKWMMLPMALFLSFTLTQCEDEEETQEPELTTATVKGKATANLIDTIPGDTNVPEGTTITLWISTEDLVTKSEPSKTYEKRYYQAEVDGEGMYSATVDVHKDPVTVHVEPNDFEVDDYVNIAGNEERRAYSANPATVDVMPDGTRIVDIQYN